jgi:hypothetical protein
MDKINSNVWVVLSVLVIWFAVIVTSLNSPELVFGDEPTVINIAAIANWFWGLLGTVFVLRATVFRRPNELGWGQTNAWPWVTVAVAVIWLLVILVALRAPDVIVNDTIIVPIGAIAAPIVGAVLTLYASEFLVSGFASREGL